MGSRENKGKKIIFRASKLGNLLLEGGLLFSGANFFQLHLIQNSF
jgi:hypothetical protein